MFDLDISLQGGNVIRADLAKYPRDKRAGSPPVRLFATQEPDFHVARSGLRALNGRAEPTHLAVFTSSATEYRLAPGAQELRVPLTWTDGQGITVTKTFVFKPGLYAIDVLYDVDNRSAGEWSGASYVQIARHAYEQERSMFDVESFAYRGPAIYDGKKYRKLDVTDDEEGKFAQNVTDGWMGSMQHHFVSAAVPGEPALITGIGINTGVLIAGGLGTSDRLNYTVIGDTVNTTQRIQGMSNHFGERGIVVSENTLVALGDHRAEFNLEPLGEHTFKGKMELLWLYRLYTNWSCIGE